MKRIISVLLIMILTLSLSLPVSADELSNIPARSVSGKKLFQYMQGDDGKLLTLRKNYGYMTFIGDFKSDALSLYLLEMTDKLIDTGATPDKEKYMETLVNIIATYDLDCADDVAKQSNMDNLKTLKDYAMDCTEMGKNAVSVMVGSNPAASELETTLSTAVDGLGVLIDNTDNWISALSNLETIVKDYSEHDEFLKLIEEESDGELKAAAQTMRKGMKEAMEIKLETYQDVSDKNYKNYEEFFFSDVFFDAVKQLPEYEDDEALKYFIDAGDDIVSKVGTLGSAWDLGKMIGTLVGDAVVGGENLINRVLEMMAIYDISEILQGKIIETGTEFLNNLGKDNEESLVETYIALSNYLIGCRIRGEYCLYSVVAEDAGLLSWFNKNSAEEARLWYDDKTKKVLAIQNNLLQVYEEDIEISSYFDQYEQLVEKLGMTPTDYWQFPDSNSYVIDQFYLEWKDNLFSMKNEGTSYIKLYGSSIGDSATELESLLQENGWINYYSNTSECSYIAIINDKEYIIYIYKDENGNVDSWYLNNWPEGEDISDLFSKLRGDTLENSEVLSGEMYEYADGEFLSDFSIYEMDGTKHAELMFWHNYGASSSDEDFFFEWEDGKWEYEVTGNRSGRTFLLNFTPTNTGLIIRVVCKEGTYYAWQTGAEAEEWVNAEYTIK